ncbi:hypothetical protein PSY80_24690, partial [Shigella flexneri]|nr:hypothetical protein [Shigella flexneri]
FFVVKRGTKLQSMPHLIILSHKWGIDCSFVPRFTTKKILIQQGSLFFVVKRGTKLQSMPHLIILSHKWGI